MDREHIKALFLLRGAPGCGKSTWIKENGYEEYTLSADSIRLILNPPVMVNGNLAISQENAGNVWSLFYELLTERIGNGLLTFVDCTNSTTREMKKYCSMSKSWGYDVYVVDFTGVDIDVCKERNRNRGWKAVPEFVIDRMYNNFFNCGVPMEAIEVSPKNVATLLRNLFDATYYAQDEFLFQRHGVEGKPMFRSYITLSEEMLNELKSKD